MAVGGRGEALAHTDLGLFVVDDPALPVSLRQLLCCGGAPATKFGWVRADGSPVIDPRAAGVLDYVGTAELTGTSKRGDAVIRRLPNDFRVIQTPRSCGWAYRFVLPI